MPTAWLLLLSTLAAASPSTVVTAERDWVSFDGLEAPPVRFETKVPAEAALVDGPAGRRAVRVTVPDLGRDEKACAFVVVLPKLGAEFNGVKLWLRGSARTKRLEIVFRTEAGCFGTDLPAEPQWREVLLGPDDTRPWFDTQGGRLEVGRATEVRFCFGEWQGHQGGPHEVSIGPLAAIQSPLFALTEPGPVETIEKPRVPLPLQPFTVELLDLNRGEWQFPDALGQRLTLDGPVSAYAFTGQAGGEVVAIGSESANNANKREFLFTKFAKISGSTPSEVRLAYLCGDPEFPEDLAYAVLKVVEPGQQSEGTSWFRVEEPYFSCSVAVRSVLPSETEVGGRGSHDPSQEPRHSSLVTRHSSGQGVFRCELHRLSFGPATPGDRYVAGLYLLAGERVCPLWLAPGQNGSEAQVRLLTDRVGHVFSEDEPVRVTLVGLPPGLPLSQEDEGHNAPAKELALQAIDYATGQVVWRGRWRVKFQAGTVTLQPFTLPLKRFGVFEVIAKVEEKAVAKVRVCRIPNPSTQTPPPSGSTSSSSKSGGMPTRSR